MPVVYPKIQRGQPLYLDYSDLDGNGTGVFPVVRLRTGTGFTINLQHQPIAEIRRHRVRFALCTSHVDCAIPLQGAYVSQLNHANHPNVVLEFSQLENTLTIRVTRNIEAGIELTLDYLLNPYFTDYFRF